eukprot:6197311-Pleurochrysis_carterae.AAC.3
MYRASMVPSLSALMAAPLPSGRLVIMGSSLKNCGLPSTQRFLLYGKVSGVGAQPVSSPSLMPV